MTRDRGESPASAPLAACVVVRVPSKVNLFLAVRGRRPDGYHELVTVMQTVAIHDRLTLSLHGTPWAQRHPAAPRAMRVELAHDGGEGVPDGADNLAMRAAVMLLEEVGARAGDTAGPGDAPLTRIELSKAIPVAAGMAGGSADAAAVLVGLDRLWSCELGRDRLRELGARLGADVPFCVTGGTVIATGTGADTAQVLVRGEFHWVVGMSADPLPTPGVYRAWDAIGNATTQEPDVVLQALRTGDADVLGAALHNDLEHAACHLRPSLRDDLQSMHDAGALGAVVSGSGPTVLALARDADDARRIAAEVADRFHRVEVATSPAGGPALNRR